MGVPDVVRRAPGCTTERVGDRVLLLDAHAQHLTTLNPVGSVVWDALDGTRGVEQIIDEVTGHLAAPAPSASAIRADVEEFLAALFRHGLVVPVDAAG